MNEVANRLLQLYKNSGYSYPELERMTGISKSTLQRYFTGGTAKIPLSKLELLAKALNSTPAYIMGWEDENQGVVPVSNLAGEDADKVHEFIRMYSALSEENKQLIDRTMKALKADQERSADSPE
ncbi:MAG: helix-turn-helix domain-containing protein [Christensenellales bacterium]|jgi:transcriptional regulator with XRE-family HTH domain